MFKNCALEQQAVALFNFLMVKHEYHKCIGELSMLDVMELVKFCKRGTSNANSKSHFNARRCIILWQDEELLVFIV